MSRTTWKNPSTFKRKHVPRLSIRSQDRLWVLLYAQAHIFPLISWLEQDPLEIAKSGAVTLLALALCLRPHSLPLFLSTAITWIIVAGTRLPNIPNHQYLLLSFDLVVCMALFSDIARSRKPTLESIVTSARTGFLTMVGIVYLFAAFAKLNHGFLSENNCATRFLANIQQFYSFVPSLPGHWLAIGTIALELFLAVLLFSPRTRPFGVRMGIVFHILLAMDPIKRFFNFSSVILLGLCSGVSFSLSEKSDSLVRFLMTSSVVAFAIFRVIDTPLISAVVLSLIWIMLALIVFSASMPSIKPYALPLQFSAVFGACLILAQGFSPYLGIKTRQSFQMYSNLTINEQNSNHLIIPKSFDLLGLMKDRVTIRKDDGGETQETSLYEFYRLLKENPDTKYSIRQGNEFKPITLDQVEKPPYWWLHWYISFYPHSKKSEECSW